MLSKLKKTMWMGGVSTMYGETEKCIQNLAWKPEGMGPLEWLSRKWEGSINMELQGIENEGLDWIHVAQQRTHLCAVLNTVIKFRDL
jgi:hypothetical protein